MAVIKAVSSRAKINTALDYVMKSEKTEKKLMTGINCNPSTAKEEMQLTKDIWEKTDGRTYKHYVQSYAPEEKITPEQAHQNAIELAKNTPAWQGYEVLISTHIDKNHIHSHFIVNSVNIENGKKLQWSKKDLVDLKNLCNEQSKEQGLHIAEKGKTFTGEKKKGPNAWNKDTYQVLLKAEKGEVDSYVQDIALAVDRSRSEARSKEDFILKMQEKGIDVNWTDNRKYITFTDIKRQESGEVKCKIRNNKLAQYFNLELEKEDLEKAFEKNGAVIQEKIQEKPKFIKVKASKAQNYKRKVKTKDFEHE